jgi:long-chain acyl-CoA synthetase
MEIDEKGELRIRGDHLFKGYYKNSEASNNAMSDGWYYTGDAFATDEVGRFLYLDRMENLLEADGKGKFSAAAVESTLRGSPYIKEGVVPVSGRPPYITALIQINFRVVAKWAESRRILYTDIADLSQKTQVHDLVKEEIQALNATLPEALRVKKFVCLPKELNPEDGELTRDGKLRKKRLRERYQTLLEAIYAGKDEFPLSMETKSSPGSSAKEICVTIITLP